MNRTDLLMHNYPEVKFGGFSNVDGTISFYSRVQSLLPKTGVVCDIGCGRGTAAADRVEYRRRLRDLRGPERIVIGLDMDPVAQSNPLINHFVLYDGCKLPLNDQSVDIVVSDFVIEHLANPRAYFAEIGRILKLGGRLCVRTPNVRSYFGLSVKLLPQRVKHQVLRSVEPDREAHDVFPALYRCNTHRALVRDLSSAGFRATVIGHEAEPAYFGFSPQLYAMMVRLHRMTPRAVATTLFAFAEQTG